MWYTLHSLCSDYTNRNGYFSDLLTCLIPLSLINVQYDCVWYSFIWPVLTVSVSINSTVVWYSADTILHCLSILICYLPLCSSFSLFVLLPLLMLFDDPFDETLQWRIEVLQWWHFLWWPCYCIDILWYRDTIAFWLFSFDRSRLVLGVWYIRYGLGSILFCWYHLYFLCSYVIFYEITFSFSEMMTFRTVQVQVLMTVPFILFILMI